MEKSNVPFCSLIPRQPFLLVIASLPAAREGETRRRRSYKKKERKKRSWASCCCCAFNIQQRTDQKSQSTITYGFLRIPSPWFTTTEKRCRVAHCCCSTLSEPIGSLKGKRFCTTLWRSSSSSSSRQNLLINCGWVNSTCIRRYEPTKEKKAKIFIPPLVVLSYVFNSSRLIGWVNRTRQRRVQHLQF